jgi:hypothetical protein
MDGKGLVLRWRCGYRLPVPRTVSARPEEKALNEMDATGPNAAAAAQTRTQSVLRAAIDSPSCSPRPLRGELEVAILPDFSHPSKVYLGRRWVVRCKLGG